MTSRPELRAGEEVERRGLAAAPRPSLARQRALEERRGALEVALTGENRAERAGELALLGRRPADRARARRRRTPPGRVCSSSEQLRESFLARSRLRRRGGGTRRADQRRSISRPRSGGERPSRATGHPRRSAAAGSRRRAGQCGRAGGGRSTQRRRRALREESRRDAGRDLRMPQSLLRFRRAGSAPTARGRASRRSPARRPPWPPRRRPSRSSRWPRRKSRPRVRERSGSSSARRSTSSSARAGSRRAALRRARCADRC